MKAARIPLWYAPQTKEHLRAIERKHHTLIRSKIIEQLSTQPTTETLNRKPLEDPKTFPAGTWEIRFGPDNRLRVLYRVKKNRVEVIAIGWKEGDRLFIAGKEVRP